MTVHELNTKAWYRLLKVVFVGSFVVFGFILMGMVADANWPGTHIDNKRTTIECHYGSKKTITAEEAKVYFRDDYFLGGEFTHHSMNGALQDACGITYDEAMSVLNETMAAMRAGKEDPHSEGLFDVHPVYDGGWGTMIVRLSITLLVLVFVAEGLRRVFYYVVLGSFRPRT